jgi:hypothetical protein
LADGSPGVTQPLPVMAGNAMALRRDGREMAIVDSAFAGSRNHSPTVRRFDTQTGMERRGFSVTRP